MSMMVSPYAFAGLATDPYFASVVLLVGANGTDAATVILDESSYARALNTQGGVQLDTAQAKFGVSSALFDGNLDFFQATDSAELEIGSGAFTYECWVRFNTLVSTTVGNAFGSKWSSSAAAIRSWAFKRDSATNELKFLYSTTGNAFSTVAFAWTPSTGVWYHIAVDRDGSNDVRLYVDGVMLVKTNIGAAVVFNSTNPFEVGRINNTSTPGPAYMDGWIDEVRLTVGVARYASDGGYTVPTAAFPRS